MPLTLASQVASVRSRVEKNTRFGIAKGLTKTAADARAQITADLPQIFDRPTPFTRNAISITPATRDRLTATVFVKDIQAKYLELEETGGTRTPIPGSPINIPVGQRVNVYGNIARGAIGRTRMQPGVFVSKGQGRTAQLRPGLYQRVGKKGRGKGPTVKLLVAFERVAVYQPRFQFKKRAADVVRRVLRDNIAAGITEAMRTAK